MKYIVIAHHHGALLTIKQLQEWKQDFIVLIPQTQLDKYSKMDDDVFINFSDSVKKLAGKKPVFALNQGSNLIVSVNDAAENLALTGQWMVLQAGSLLLSHQTNLLMDSRFGLVKDRVHPKFKRLYKLLGQEEESKKFYPNIFVLDMDKKKPHVTELPSDLFMRPDILYAKSFNALWCLRHRQMVNESHAMNFWMEVIREDQETGEWVGYPYHIYAPYAKKVKNMLPAATYNNIIENAKQSAWIQDLVALDL